MNIESDPKARDGEADHAPDFAVLLRRSALNRPGFSGGCFR
jgi:hypothetical protein